MRLIHCADLHLDSRMNSNFEKGKARERRTELLNTYIKMIDYADRNHVDAILIAGDLFDTKNISATARNVVSSSINDHPEIRFFYLKGNHDHDNFLSDLDSMPENLYLFGDSWQSYSMGVVRIYGLELSKKNSKSAGTDLIIDSHDFNIVMLHGQQADSTAGQKAEIINIKEFRNKGIDYLALGHIHSYRMSELDARGKYCYPGCLEGRGFDECGEKGFVLLDINEVTGGYEAEFIPFAKRQIYEIEADVSDCRSTAEMITCINRVIQEKDCMETDLVKVILQGALDVECEKDSEYIVSYYRDRYYDARVSDLTSYKIDIGKYMLDESLKGEFVRTVMNDNNISEQERSMIIHYGFQAITGEEIG